MQKKYYYIKATLDFIFALKLLFLLSPLLLLISLLIKMTSKGPVLFKQERLGQNGKIFIIYKFRTMINKAIDVGSGLHTYANDPRITKLGKVLRKTSLDELPQLINILKGDMSFIGPRPPVTYYPQSYEDYSEESKKRFLLKPGITGYAQVKVRNNANWDEKMAFDLIYIYQFSFKLDLIIFLKTLKVLITEENIYQK